MARAIRWRMQFKSLNNTGCLVNIYDENSENIDVDVFHNSNTVDGVTTYEDDYYKTGTPYNMPTAVCQHTPALSDSVTFNRVIFGPIKRVYSNDEAIINYRICIKSSEDNISVAGGGTLLKEGTITLTTTFQQFTVELENDVTLAAGNILCVYIYRLNAAYPRLLLASANTSELARFNNSSSALLYIRVTTNTLLTEEDCLTRSYTTSSTHYCASPILRLVHLASEADTTKTGANVPFAVENGVTELIGTGSPFEFQEDDDEDLLRVVRYRTGYIRLTEATFDALSDIYPATNKSRYVECFYGSNKVFSGYIQAQSGEYDWVAPPRTIDLPIMSPIGLANGINLNEINPPTRVTLATLLSEVVTGLDGGYEYVILPDTDHNLELDVNSLVVSPLSSDFSQSPSMYSTAFEPISYMELLEGICNAFGWMLHDTPNALVFTMIDYDGDYAQYSVSGLATLTGKTIIATTGADVRELSNIISIADNDGKESTILPLKNITLNYQGDYSNSVSFDFSRLVYTGERHYSNNHAAWFKCVDGTLSGTYLLWDNMINTANGHITNYGAIASECGTPDDQLQCILVKVNPSWSYSTSIFTMKFFNRPTANGFLLKMDLKVGNVVSDLIAVGDENAPTHYDLLVSIKCGDAYYDGAGVWVTNPAEPTKFATLNFPITPLDVYNIPSNDFIQLDYWLAYSSSTPSAELIAVYNVELSEKKDLYSDYKVYEYQSPKISMAQGSDTEGDVDLLFSWMRANSNMLGDTVMPAPTFYKYLAQSQRRINIPARVPTFAYDFYIAMYQYWLQTNRWRLIAASFEPREDLYRLVLHTSPVLESLAAIYSVTVQGNVITQDTHTTVAEGGELEVFLSPMEGYTLDSAQVVMGGVDVSADAFDSTTNTVYIESVTGNVLIYGITSEE